MCCINNPDGGRHTEVVANGRTVPTASLPWNPHPKFAGVSLKHFVTGKDTGGRLSLHHVRIDPGCTIGDHAHAGQIEIHDVIAGNGTCTLESSVIPYAPGIVGVMPADRVHRINAGDGGLLLLATFSPPLV
ncbi:MAG: cupin [Methanomicrobiales archaeon HGW-Methanomicrobiales-1]|nr:MAG: cupin [Methanomicrobiales archaeon HGW-Methanomicrobiales-1]